MSLIRMGMNRHLSKIMSVVSGFFTVYIDQRIECTVKRLTRCVCIPVYPLVCLSSCSDPLYLRDLINASCCLWELYGDWLSPSLFTPLIPRLMICSKAMNGIDGARDGEQTPGAGYSEVVEIRANFFDKL